MSTFSIKTVQKIPVDIETVWAFFSNPDNLRKITPANLGFKVLSKHHGDKVYPGQIIEYKVSPVLGIPVYWMTEITHVKDKELFIDEQRFGPYQLWQHQHHFSEIPGGVEMIDIVHYRNPAIIGGMANLLFVRGRLKKIFEYRFRKVEEVFGRWNEGAVAIEFS